ncbi:unnamed protein product [Penicillium olsonii]|nr:unnamed protein product [Penicillium olsonii]
MLRNQALRRVLRAPLPAPLRHQPPRIHSLRYGARPRGLATTAIPSVLVPPLMFVGLLVGLWTWKCFWIIVLQNKLLYLTWLPPFTRSEVIADYPNECKPVRWRERQIRSLDGTKLAVCEGRISVVDCKSQSLTSGSDFKKTTQASSSNRKKAVVICYFQGNGGSLPMRLPILSRVLRTISETATSSGVHSDSQNTEYTVLALSYRGYWTSAGRATQSGLEMDAQACLIWISETYGGPETDLEIVLWGHSLGAAVAASATPAYIARCSQAQGNRGDGQPLALVTRLILEAPTSSIKDMLISLYPQKWLPYRYLWPFSWNNWDIKASLRHMASWRDQDGVHHGDTFHSQSTDGGLQLEAAKSRSESIPPIFLLSAEKDEVIPAYVPGQIEAHAKSLGLSIETKSVTGAMHADAPLKLDGRKSLARFILNGNSATGSP